MAQRHIDITARADESSISTAANSDGLTGDVRIVWETGTLSQDVIGAVQKALNKLMRLESGSDGGWANGGA